LLRADMMRGAGNDMSRRRQVDDIPTARAFFGF
jgi:hypothetical protein